MEINIKQLLLTYKTITAIMEEEHLTMDTSFRRVQSFISNKVCDMLTDGEVI